MRVARLDPRPRVAFLVDAALALHVPSACDWAEARTILVPPGGWRDAARAAAAFRPDVAVVMDALRIDAEVLAALPGIKIGVVVAPPDGSGLGRLAELASEPAGAGFAWLTWPDASPPPDPKLRILQSLPVPIDTARMLSSPALDRRALAVAAAALPPPEVLERLRDLADVTILEDGEDLPHRLAECGLLVHWSERPLGADALPLLAMANGLLLLANQAFPASLGIEPEDEYLPRPSGKALLAALDESLRMPEATRAVRVRAWQRARETFAASSAFERLVHDALLEADGPTAAGRTARSGDGARS